MGARDHHAPATKSRLLDAAEALFARHGFDGASLRQITATAKANLAAANYHFRDKESLYAAVLLRRLQPINARRRQLLAAARLRAAPDPAPVVAILESFIAPVADLAAISSAKAPPSLRLMGRMLSDPLPFLDPIIASEFAPLIRLYGEAFAAVLPGLSPDELYWRMHFVAGAMLHAFGNGERIAGLDPRLGTDRRQVRARLIAFAAAGLAAPALPSVAAGEPAAT